MGLSAVAAPIFTISPLPWDAPDPARYDAVLLTSANAARLAGPQLARFTHLPCYAVGPSTAAAASRAGFAILRQGSGDGRAVVALMTENGVARAIHLCGREHMPLGNPALSIDDVAVYAADAVGALPAAAREALGVGAVALLHSPRAARVFAALVDRAALKRETIALAAISDAASAAAGDGWRRKGEADRPRDNALLELAAKLCNNGRAATSVGG